MNKCLLIMNTEEHKDLAALVQPEELLFNAPRPIYGDSDWIGTWRHGTYYAIVKPKVDGDRKQIYDRASYIRDAADSHAWLLEFITEEDARAAVEGWVASMGMSDIIDDDMFERNWEQSFYQNFGATEVETSEL